MGRVKFWVLAAFPFAFRLVSRAVSTVCPSLGGPIVPRSPLSCHVVANTILLLPSFFLRGGRKIPAATLTTLYLDDAIEFNMDVLEALESIDDFVCYMPSWPTIKFLLLQLFPNSNNSSLKDKKTTKREIADHYDRGNDFFNAFLGPRMIYTSAVFETAEDTLETAQDNKMRKVRRGRGGGTSSSPVVGPVLSPSGASSYHRCPSI